MLTQHKVLRMLFAVVISDLFLSPMPAHAQTKDGIEWTQLDTTVVLGNGGVTAIAVSGTNIFAGTYSGGVLLSTDDGASWRAVNTGLTAQWVTALAVTGTNIYAGTYGRGVFFSTDDGANWIAVNKGLPHGYINSLAVSGSTIFAGTYTSGVFLSTDSGTSWVAAGAGLTGRHVTALAASGTTIFAGIFDDGVFVSTNNGASWNPANTGLTEHYISVLSVNGMNVFAGSTGWAGGVFLSTNHGASWTTVTSDLTCPSIGAIAVIGTNLLAGSAGCGVFLSNNNGKTWTPVSAGLTAGNVQSLAVRENKVFAVTPVGIFRANLPTRFRAQTIGLTDLLNQYWRWFQGNPDNFAVRKGISSVVQKMKPAPIIAEEARQHFIMAKTLFEGAGKTEDYDASIAEFKKALLIVPWWPEANYNLALAFEAAQKFDEAKWFMHLYIASNPGAENTRAAQDEIYKMQAKQELVTRQKAEREAKMKAEEEGRLQKQREEEKRKGERTLSLFEGRWRCDYYPIAGGVLNIYRTSGKWAAIWSHAGDSEEHLAMQDQTDRVRISGNNIVLMYYFQGKLDYYFNLTMSDDESMLTGTFNIISPQHTETWMYTRVR